MTVYYTLADSPLGRLLLAGTENGIAALTFGDDDKSLEEWLQGEFRTSPVIRDDERLRPWLASVLDHMHGEKTHTDLPLDMRATAFQKRVWDELCKIPYGQTRTYAQVAAALGQPTAARAVARACATNPASLVVPCHRVVRGDGNLGGYRWGLDRKRQLLERERA
jgi:AraC family transcriptional regulator of adaptative response/methylated-DNA-[protein]-cysteine methyltransferase